jgi:predicted nucleic acid-binding Zn ribbon protein
MRTKNDQSLGDVIREFIEAYKLDDKLHEIDIQSNWEKIAGKVIARHTRKIYILRRTLYVKVDSAALRQELLMAKSRLMEALNKSFDVPVIDDIVFK